MTQNTLFSLGFLCDILFVKNFKKNTKCGMSTKEFCLQVTVTLNCLGLKLHLIIDVVIIFLKIYFISECCISSQLDLAIQ